MNSERRRKRRKEKKRKEKKKISSNSYYHITLNGNSRKQHISYKLIPFSSLLLLSQLCFIVPTLKCSLHLSDDTHSRLFFVIKLTPPPPPTTTNKNINK
jgi:hypothetical protein